MIKYIIIVIAVIYLCVFTIYRRRTIATKTKSANNIDNLKPNNSSSIENTISPDNMQTQMVFLYKQMIELTKEMNTLKSTSMVDRNLNFYSFDLRYSFIENRDSSNAYVTFEPKSEFSYIDEGDDL